MGISQTRMVASGAYRDRTGDLRLAKPDRANPDGPCSAGIAPISGGIRTTVPGNGGGFVGRGERRCAVDVR
jgi:hypothetical protein